MRVRAARQGDRAALTSVLESVQEPILRYCRGRLGVGERHLFSADDVAQEALMAVMTALPPLSRAGQGPSWPSWRWNRIAQGCTRDESGGPGPVRSRGRRPLKRSPVSPAPNNAPSTLTQADRCANCSNFAGEATRSAGPAPVVGLSADETAAVVGSTAGRCGWLQHRALA